MITTIVGWILIGVTLYFFARILGILLNIKELMMKHSLMTIFVRIISYVSIIVLAFAVLWNL